MSESMGAGTPTTAEMPAGGGDAGIKDPSPRHPRGLFTLLFTEVWERSTYHGVRSILILFMTAVVADGGLGIDDKTASAIYGLYISATFLLSLWGGWIADRLVGQQRAIVSGGILIALGNTVLVFGNHFFFFVGLVIIVFGTGLLKPNISAIVAQLYPEGGARRDAGFSIFYMGISLGALLGQLVVPITATVFGWRTGFALPALGMSLGLLQFHLGRKYLAGAGQRPAGDQGSWWPVYALVGMMALLVVLGGMQLIRFDPVAISRFANWTMILLAVLFFAYLLFFAGLSNLERRRVLVLIILATACAMYCAGSEQAGASFTLFAQRYTDRDLFGMSIPAGAMQAVSSLSIVIFAPIFAAMWIWLGKRNLDPSIPVKFALGLLFLALGFATMVLAARYVMAGQTVVPTWLALTYLFHSFGELCLSPVGLSSMTKLAPPRFVGQVLGIWFLATAIGNNLAGQFAGQIDASDPSTLLSQYRYLFWWGAAGGIGMLALTPIVKRLMGGVR